MKKIVVMVIALVVMVSANLTCYAMPKNEVITSKNSIELKARVEEKNL